MNGVGARKLGDPDHLVDRQIAFDRPEIARQMRTTADLVALIRLEAMQRQLVLFRPDRHRFDSELVGRAEHANGYFRAIGNEYLGNGQNGLLRRSEAGMLHPRRKFLTSCHRKFNFSCDCETHFLAMRRHVDWQYAAILAKRIRKAQLIRPWRKAIATACCRFFAFSLSCRLFMYQSTVWFEIFSILLISIDVMPSAR